VPAGMGFGKLELASDVRCYELIEPVSLLTKNR
jgi:hypothetical protein